MSVADRVPGVSEYGSVDPAPPSTESRISKLAETLLDEETKMFERMRAVFSLRNNRSKEAVEVLCKGFKASSALLRHELAYVLGQMQDNHAVPTLINVLSDENEHVMVRHEAAEALGAIGDRRAKSVLEHFLQDPLPEVSESCEVALDLLALCEEPSDVNW
ncbi:MAG: HEAT repeat domain-containing protein [Candidatus Poseidoniaceae archaeon]